MDILQLMYSKAFYGREFLTWLWFKSETSTGRFTESIELWVDDMITLESHDGQQTEKVILKGVKSQMMEAKLALRNGKKVVEAKFILIIGDKEWSFTLDCTQLAYRTMKTPECEKAKREEEEDGFFYDKIKLVEQAVSSIDTLFEIFMAKRLGSEEWEKERKEVWNWILNETTEESFKAAN